MMVDRASQQPYRVVYVCTGNTCRSPMAEGILRKLVLDLGDQAPAIESLSAGTMYMVGSPASQFSVSVCADYDIDICDHRSQGATPELLDAVDLVMALAVDHFNYTIDLGIDPDKVYLVRGFPNRDVDLVHASIADPIGMQREAYQQVFFQMEESIRRGLPEIVKRAREKASQT